MFTTVEKFKCALRELKMRRAVYARRVQVGGMTQTNADREIGLMEEIVADYRKQMESERLL